MTSLTSWKEPQDVHSVTMLVFPEKSLDTASAVRRPYTVQPLGHAIYPCSDDFRWARWGGNHLKIPHSLTLPDARTCSIFRQPELTLNSDSLLGTDVRSQVPVLSQHLGPRSSSKAQCRHQQITLAFLAFSPLPSTGSAASYHDHTNLKSELSKRLPTTLQYPPSVCGAQCCMTGYSLSTAYVLWLTYPQNTRMAFHEDDRYFMCK